jgi:hypothetical protein
MTWQRHTFVLALAALAAAGCGKRVPGTIGGPPGSPRVGWVIMSGDADTPDRDYACQSIDQTPCVVPASRAGARAFGHAHFYYHPASVETTYAGSIRIGFFGGSSGPHELKPNVDVKPGDAPYNQSVMDSITTKPGTYEMTIDVVATAVPTGEKQNIRDRVSVLVR